MKKLGLLGAMVVMMIPGTLLADTSIALGSPTSGIATFTTNGSDTIGSVGITGLSFSGWKGLVTVAGVVTGHYKITGLSTVTGTLLEDSSVEDWSLTQSSGFTFCYYSGSSCSGSNILLSGVLTLDSLFGPNPADPTKGNYILAGGLSSLSGSLASSYSSGPSVQLDLKVGVDLSEHKGKTTVAISNGEVAVAEPSTLGLAGFALLGLIGVGVVRRKDLSA